MAKREENLLVAADILEEIGETSLATTLRMMAGEKTPSGFLIDLAQVSFFADHLGRVEVRDIIMELREHFGVERLDSQESIDILYNSVAEQLAEATSPFALDQRYLGRNLIFRLDDKDPYFRHVPASIAIAVNNILSDGAVMAIQEVQEELEDEEEE